jgi:hypothetical protein
MIQVNGYQPRLPIDPPFIVSNLSATAFDTNSKMLVVNLNLSLKLCFRGLEMLI